MATPGRTRRRRVQKVARPRRRCGAKVARGEHAKRAAPGSPDKWVAPQRGGRKTDAATVFCRPFRAPRPFVTNQGLRAPLRFALTPGYLLSAPSARIRGSFLCAPSARILLSA